MQREKGKDRDRRDSRRSASSQTHSSARLIPISCSLAAPLADMEHSENRLRLFTATLLFSFFLSFPSPRCSCAHISPDRAQTGRLRLKQHTEDTARILGCIGIRKGTCSFILSRSQLEWPPGRRRLRQHQSPSIKATHQEYFSNTARALCLSFAPLWLFC